ncbi:MAG: hypothetical protein EBY37_05950 [Flavobacteriia bacterium]|nr:hypothetical protein [Flavobacteriia bacterium]
MAVDTLYFSRDTKVYIKIGSAIWEVPVLDGFSFSQASNSTEVTLAEMEDTSGASKRGRAMFNDSLAPVEWSFSTYVRPFVSAGSGAGAADNAANHHAVEEVLWALMVGDAAYSSFSFTGFTADTTDLDIAFSSSNKSTLGTADIFFVLGSGKSNPTVYKCASAVVNEASMDFDIDGLATINWSGFASTLTSDSAPTATVYEDITATDNFIRNRLSVLEITANDDTVFPGSGSGVYTLTLTGGNITVSNNISYITPEELGVVNSPVGHVTGARSISGAFTCYLGLDSNTNTGTSTDFFNDMTSASATAKITNSFNTTFNIGGNSATPRLEFAMPTAHFEIPAHGIEDVISLETNFHGLPSTISGTNEATIKYVGAA